MIIGLIIAGSLLLFFCLGFCFFLEVAFYGGTCCESDNLTAHRILEALFILGMIGGLGMLISGILIPEN